MLVIDKRYIRSSVHYLTLQLGCVSNLKLFIHLIAGSIHVAVKGTDYSGALANGCELVNTRHSSGLKALDCFSFDSFPKKSFLKERFNSCLCDTNLAKDQSVKTNKHFTNVVLIDLMNGLSDLWINDSRVKA